MGGGWYRDHLSVPQVAVDRGMAGRQAIGSPEFDRCEHG